MAQSVRGVERYRQDHRPGRAQLHPGPRRRRHPDPKAAEVEALFWHIYKRVYTLPAILRRTLFHRRMRQRPGQTLFLLMVNLVYRSQIRRRVSSNIL